MKFCYLNICHAMWDKGGGGGAMESIDGFYNTLVFSGLCIMIDILAV